MDFLWLFQAKDSIAYKTITVISTVVVNPLIEVYHLNMAMPINVKCRELRKRRKMCICTGSAFIFSNVVCVFVCGCVRARTWQASTPPVRKPLHNMREVTCPSVTESHTVSLMIFTIAFCRTVAVLPGMSVHTQAHTFYLQFNTHEYTWTQVPCQLRQSTKEFSAPSLMLSL